MTIAMCAFLIGSILIATAPVDQIYWGQLFFAAIITPFGMDSEYMGQHLHKNVFAK